MTEPDRKIIGQHAFRELEKTMLPVFTQMSVSEIEKIFSKPPSGTIEERIKNAEGRSRREALLFSHFNRDILLQVSPVWFQPENFLEEILSINEPHIWQAIASHSPRYEQGRRGQLKRPANISEQEWERIQDTVHNNPQFVAEANTGLFALAFASVGLGVIIGSNFQQVIGDMSNAMYAGLLAGKHQAPAQDTKEGIQRLQTIYGDQGYALLQQTSAFENSHPEENPPRIGRCSFQFDPVKKLLKAFALHIQTEPYATYFAERISH